LPLGSKLDIQALDAFREDVAKSLRNVGYPSIQESHIYFVADTSFDPKGHRTRIEAEILPQDWDEFGSLTTTAYQGTFWVCELDGWDSARFEFEWIGFIHGVISHFTRLGRPI